MNDFLVPAACSLNDSYAESETRTVVLYIGIYQICIAVWWKGSNNFTTFLELTSIYIDRLYTVYCTLYTVLKIHYKFVKLTIFAVLIPSNNGENRRASSAACLYLLFMSLRMIM